MSVKDHVIWKASAVQILRPVAFPVRLYWSTAATQPRINNDDNTTCLLAIMKEFLLHAERFVSECNIYLQ